VASRVNKNGYASFANKNGKKQSGYGSTYENFDKIKLDELQHDLEHDTLGGYFAIRT